MKKLILIVLFFVFAPLNLVVSFFVLSRLSLAHELNASLLNPLSEIKASSPSRLYTALPAQTGEILGAVSAADARPIIIENYLQKHHSPMAPYYRELLLAAEKYQVDPWLIIAIAQCESNLCKKSPPDSYNCWGFENGSTKFLSWEQALNQVAKTIRERYLDFGLETPEEMMPKYAPPSVEKGGPWAQCVRQFVEELERGG